MTITLITISLFVIVESTRPRREGRGGGHVLFSVDDVAGYVDAECGYSIRKQLNLNYVSAVY